jgi:signal transduction histidine kinase
MRMDLGVGTGLLGRLRAPLHPDQRGGLRILVVMRWMMVGGSFVTLNALTDRTTAELVGLNGVLAVALVLNCWMQWLMLRERSIPLALPVAASLYDIAAITAAIALVEGFANPDFFFYFPALLAFMLVFPGRWSASYSVLALVAYVALVLISGTAFDGGSDSDIRGLVIRLVAIAATIIVAIMIVRIERTRRDRAVAAERAATVERDRVSEEIHDGVAQNVYMLAMNLETAARLSREADDAPQRREQLEAMVRLAKQTLIETRGLLVNVQPAMTGAVDLPLLLENQAHEFSTVTGIPVRVRSSGQPVALAAEGVGELYRVVQEGLANIYKHAGATSVELSLRYAGDHVVIELLDDGEGIELSGKASRGHGLTIMQERAMRVGGELVVEPRGERGTRLTLIIPIGQA